MLPVIKPAKNLEEQPTGKPMELAEERMTAALHFNLVAKMDHPMKWRTCPSCARDFIPCKVPMIPAKISGNPWHKISTDLLHCHLI